MGPTNEEAPALFRRTRARIRQFLEGIEELIKEDIAAAAPGRERAYVRRLAKENLAIAQLLRNELKVSYISEARKKRRKG